MRDDGTGRRLAGYRVAPPAPHRGDGQAPPYLASPVYRDMLTDLVIRLAGVSQPRLRTVFGTVLGTDLPASATPGTAYAAIAGHFLALELVDGVVAARPAAVAGTVVDNAGVVTVLADERLLPTGTAGQMSLHLGRDSVADPAPPSGGGVAEQLCWLAARTGGLPAGFLVISAAGTSQPGLPARPGPVRVHGPRGSALAGLLITSEVTRDIAA
jgi:hypothetical protein